MAADPATRDPPRRAAAALGVYALLGGAVSLLGWVLDAPRLTDWAANGISIQPNATLCVATSALGLLLLAAGRRRGAAACGALVALLAAATLLEIVSGVSLGIDSALLFGREWGRVGVVVPGRMGPPGSISWTLIGSALALSARPRARRRVPALALATACLSGLSLVGYLYQVDALFTLPRLTVIAFQSATFVMAVSLGLILTQPDLEPMRTLLDRGSAGTLARRTLPVILTVPAALGWLRVEAGRAGLVDTRMGTALLVLSLVLLLAAVLWRGARVVASRDEVLRHAERLQTVGRLAGGVAHEANNQMTVVLGCAEFALRRQDLPAAAREDLIHIRMAAERTAAITSQLLAFSRRQMLRPAPLDLNATVEAFEPILRRTLGDTAELALGLAPGLPRVMADRGKIEQVLVNLAFNARDAMPHGGRLTITTGASAFSEPAALSDPAEPLAPGRYAVLCASDTGRGMSPETLSRAFEPFFTTKPVGEGAGLGLSSVYGIVRQLGGDVVAESELGAGATVRVYIPLAEGPAASEPARRPAGAIRTSAAVLVVENEALVRAVGVRALEQGGFQVLEAENGENALELLGRGDFAVQAVVSDVDMPVVGGRALAERLAAAYPRLPVLLTSGHAATELARLGVLPDQERTILQKPFSPDDLVVRVRALVDGARASLG